jgi:hypothetical protein
MWQASKSNMTRALDEIVAVVLKQHRGLSAETAEGSLVFKKKAATDCANFGASRRCERPLQKVDLR